MSVVILQFLATSHYNRSNGGGLRSWYDAS